MWLVVLHLLPIVIELSLPKTLYEKKREYIIPSLVQVHHQTYFYNFDVLFSD
jgi:hypothetical protein